jgi:broad specificity phosphatase PhoE
MSTIVVIRHGQASFGAADYDVLSPLGERQSALLGAHFKGAERRFDAVYCGPLRRQRDTARHIARALQPGAPDRGPFAAPRLSASFNEFAAFAIIEHGLPALINAGAIPKSQAEAFVAAARAPVEHRQTFELMFQFVLRRWAAGELDSLPAFASIERFVDFRARVVDGLHELAALHGRGQRVAVISSAGVIGVALAAALELSPWDSIKTSLMVANSSLTEFKYREPDDLHLSAFNHVPHLTPALVTLR